MQQNVHHNKIIDNHCVSKKWTTWLFNEENASQQAWFDHICNTLCLNWFFFLNLVSSIEPQITYFRWKYHSLYSASLFVSDINYIKAKPELKGKSVFSVSSVWQHAVPCPASGCTSEPGGKWLKSSKHSTTHLSTRSDTSQPTQFNTLY